MLLVNKVEDFFPNIGFVDCKWSNLNAPVSYTPWSHSILGSILDCPFHWMQEKGNVACGLLKECRGGAESYSNYNRNSNMKTNEYDILELLKDPYSLDGRGRSTPQLMHPHSESCAKLIETFRSATR